MRVSLFYEHAIPRPWDERSEQRSYLEGLTEAEAADKAGFSTIWATEHHFLEEYSHMSAPEVWLSAVSQRTKNIRIGHGIMHMLPTVNHPIRVAERVSMLDLISDGRVEFGTGESATVAEMGGFGVDPGEKRAMWEESLQVTIRAMTETPFRGIQGRFVDFPPRNVVPKPLQKPHPPTWVACTQHSTTIMAAENALGALSFSFLGPDSLTERVKEYYSTVEQRGVPLLPRPTLNLLAVAGDMPLMIGPTDEAAVQRLDRKGGFAFAFGIRRYGSQLHRPGVDVLWDEYLEKVKENPAIEYGPKRGPTGSADTVREFLKTYEATGVDEILLLLNPTSHEATMESIEIMGRDILPEFIEREEKAAAAKAKRLEPILELLESRRIDCTPEYDTEYKFGGPPVSKDGTKDLGGEAAAAEAEAAIAGTRAT